ncbi:MAG: hypothetical protein GXO29_06165, partial [Thermotogae bacterium]|nr:hypothetical protein [Thermotogota bacterium]
MAATPLMGVDSVEVYLPSLKLIFSVDETPTKIPVLDSTEYAYIALLKKNIAYKNIVEIISFRDFPPVGWYADSVWSMKFEQVGNSYIYPAIVYTSTPGTGDFSLTSGEIDLSETDVPVPDSLIF